MECEWGIVNWGDDRHFKRGELGLGGFWMGGCCFNGLRFCEQVAMFVALNEIARGIEWSTEIGTAE